MSSISGVAEFPELIRNMFVTKEKNVAGITQVQFYIRGKPWTFDIDSKFLFKNPDYSGGDDKLEYAYINTYEVAQTVMWAPLLEKAWAKIKGNYMQADGGFIATGLTSVTGAPVFSYLISEIGSTESDKMTLDETFTLISQADTAEYIMGVGTSGSSDTLFNYCGIA